MCTFECACVCDAIKSILLMQYMDFPHANVIYHIA